VTVRGKSLADGRKRRIASNGRSMMKELSISVQPEEGRPLVRPAAARDERMSTGVAKAKSRRNNAQDNNWHFQIGKTFMLQSTDEQVEGHICGRDFAPSTLQAPCRLWPSQG